MHIAAMIAVKWFSGFRYAQFKYIFLIESGVKYALWWWPSRFSDRHKQDEL